MEDNKNYSEGKRLFQLSKETDEKQDLKSSIICVFN